MLIKELKEILQNFEDNKDVAVFLEITPNFGILYEIDDWVDNNGHLDLGITDTKKNLKSNLNSIQE